MSGFCTLLNCRSPVCHERWESFGLISNAVQNCHGISPKIRGARFCFQGTFNYVVQPNGEDGSSQFEASNGNRLDRSKTCLSYQEGAKTISINSCNLHVGACPIGVRRSVREVVNLHIDCVHQYLWL